jgi:lactate dehydrogenase-like 2-hydroxyacid dehydrogenase
MGVDVFGKTLGIVGMGRIGTAVARRGSLGFGMRVLYTANSPKPEVEAELGATHVDFATLLKESDFVSINAPMTPATNHLFTMHEFRQMKPSAFLINTSRGPLVKEADLVHALREGVIRGAALDVFEHEPLMADGLAELRHNLIVAPHVGSATVETRQKMSLLAAENVVVFFNGKRPLTLVNPQVLQ